MTAAADFRTSPPVDRKAEKRRRVAIGALQLLGSAIAFAVLFRIVSFAALADAFSRVSFFAFVLAVALVALNIGVAAARWRLLLIAYGAKTPPRYGRLLFFYFVGLFYNLLPGGIAGDVVRGVMSREAFDVEGARTRGVAVVFVERVLGVAGLLAVTSTTSALFPIVRVPGVQWVCGIGIVLAIAAVAGIPIARRLARFIPGRLGTFAANLPGLARRGPFLVAAFLSLGTQSLVALSGYVLLSAIDPRLSMAEAFVGIPLASAGAFFPLSAGGAGAREGVFVWFFTQLGYDKGDALAGSLLLFLAQTTVSLFGGAMHLWHQRMSRSPR